MPREIKLIMPNRKKRPGFTGNRLKAVKTILPEVDPGIFTLIRPGNLPGIIVVHFRNSNNYWGQLTPQLS
jgi:hypothetical protein